MQVFVYEHMNGGSLSGQPGKDSLRAEGWAMLVALLQDLQRCPGVETVTQLDQRRTLPGRFVSVASAAEADARFRKLAREADRTVVIAPETDGVLEERCRRVVEAGGHLLGPSPEAVRLTADKLALAARLTECDVPNPTTWPADSEVSCPFPFPVVVKPRDGAGSVATVLIRSREEWDRRHALINADGWHGETIVQPFLPGQAASVGVLVGRSRADCLCPALQRLSVDGRFRYEGGSAPIPVNLEERAKRLARRTVDAVPGLKGFVGIDLVLGAHGDGRDDAVIEINPRLTTSYVGLRSLAQFNLAEAMIAACEGQPLSELHWDLRASRWDSAGIVETDSVR